MMDQNETGIRNWLRRRAILQSRAFRRLFEGEDRKLSRDGAAVLADLREFCFAQKSTFDADPREHAKREGRREVWLRITRFLNLDEDQVQQLMEVDDGL